LQDLRISLPSLPLLYCDNLSALHMTINPVFHARIKHIELNYHYVREWVALGHLVTHHIPTHDQVADLFTKPMSKATLMHFQTKLCLQPRPRLREDINNNQLFDDNHAEKGNKEQLETNPYDCATNNDNHAKKGNKEPLETNPYDCVTNNDNHEKKGNKESLEPDPYDCATDNGKLLED